MANDKSEIVSSKMEGLVQGYKAQLVNTISLIESIIADDAHLEDQHMQLRNIAHKLTGTGATFGFPEITQSARTLENFIDNEVFAAETIRGLALNLLTTLKQAATNQQNLPDNGLAKISLPKDASILIADDDEILLLMLKNLFLKSGCEVVCANNGKDALAALERDKFSLVIFDLFMPGYGGLELAKLMKTNIKHKTTPIIILTASDKPENIREGIEIGVEQYFTKPFQPQEILSKAAELLEALN